MKSPVVDKTLLTNIFLGQWFPNIMAFRVNQNSQRGKANTAYQGRLGEDVHSFEDKLVVSQFVQEERRCDLQWILEDNDS